jgi:hypothetical protein
VDGPIVVRYKWTEEELLAAQRSYFHHSQVGRSFRLPRILGTIFLIVGLLNGLVMLMRQWNARIVIWNSMPLVFLGMLFYSFPWIAERAILRAALKQFAKRPDKDSTVTLEISAERLVVRTAIRNVDSAWSTITKVVWEPEGLLFFMSEAQFHWLPAHGFANRDEMVRLAQLARTKVRQFDDKTSTAR